MVKVGEQLLVLAYGGKMDELGGVPLVVPKAGVEITSHAGSYVIAKPPLITEQEPGWSAAIAAMGTRTVTKRPLLDVTEAAIVGNPAGRPIEPGDHVIRERDLAEFVKHLTKSAP
jgi:hypothetical protein